MSVISRTRCDWKLVLVRAPSTKRHSVPGAHRANEMLPIKISLSMVALTLPFWTAIWISCTLLLSVEYDSGHATSTMVLPW